nr:hypothetical protein [Tanacetum cinerariifolium]
MNQFEVKVNGYYGTKKMNRSNIGNDGKKEDGCYYGFNTKSKLIYRHVSKMLSPIKHKERVNMDSESDMEGMYDENAHYGIERYKKGSGFRNKSLYEVWKETIDDNEDDPYDDEYNTHGLSQKKEAFCDAWDIKLHGRRK